MTRKIHAVIVRFSNQHNIDRTNWKNLALFIARANLESAPPQIRVLLAGKPSQVSQHVCELTEIFALLYFNAQDRAMSSNTCFSVTEVWRHAIRLWEAHHG